ncbi:MAG: NUDIX domain-containing protein, partial [Bacteroidota bacterium]
PTGTLEQVESNRHCAIREVEEETAVKVKIDKKVKSVWHTYISHKKYVLKKTHWYAMTCLSDKNLAPQKEEGIKNVKWMEMEEVRKALHGSYRSIRYVMQEYTKRLGKTTD